MNDSTPDRKVVVGAAMGGLIAFIAWLIETFGNGVKLSADAALGLQTALVFLVQYIVPNGPRYPDANPSIPPSSHWLVGVIAFKIAIVVAVFSVLLSGCIGGTPPLKPTRTACAQGETFEIKRCVKTIAEEYEIYQKRALAVVQDPGVPEDAKEHIRRIDAEMTPTLVEMLRAARTYDHIQLQLAAGETEQERFEIANQELLNWINMAEPILLRFIEAVGG